MGLRMVSGAINWYDERTRLFRYANAYSPQKGWHRVRNIRPDVVYDKTFFSSTSYSALTHLATYLPVVNAPEFTQIIDNKLFTNVLFPLHSKKYYRVTSRADLQAVAKHLSGLQIVLKPIFGSGGEGIQFVHKKQLPRVVVSRPLLAQEFLDTSFGIAGITTGHHDLRLVFINNKLIYSYIRTPAPGSLLANIMQGGSMEIVPRTRLPKSIWPIVEHFQHTFSQCNPKVYTIDIMFDRAQRPWVVETNSKPGVYFYDSQKKEQDRFYSGLIQMLMDTIDHYEKN